MTTKRQTFSQGETRLIGQGAEAEVFERQDGRVLKLRSHGSVERMAHEVAALEAARSAGVRVPQAYEQVVVDGRPGLVRERLQGTDLFSLMGRKPWLVFRSGRLTGDPSPNQCGPRASLAAYGQRRRAGNVASLGRRELAV